MTVPVNTKYAAEASVFICFQVLLLIVGFHRGGVLQCTIIDGASSLGRILDRCVVWLVVSVQCTQRYNGYIHVVRYRKVTYD